MTSALPYHLQSRPRVLVLGAGAGAGVLQAISTMRARSTPSSRIRSSSTWSSGVSRTSGRRAARRVCTCTPEARGFVARSRERYDLIEVALQDAFGASSAALRAIGELSLHVEALITYLAASSRPACLADHALNCRRATC
jgi:hypothetical protein